MFDIDDFKKVNDSYGHDTGDYVLKQIASITKEISRNADVFIRWGGEEFIILCPQTDVKDAYSFADRLRKSIEEYKFKDVEKVTASFGVSAIDSTESLRLLIDRVDSALYKSKENGKNMVTEI